MSEHPDDSDFGFEPDHGQDDHPPWETGGAHETDAHLGESGHLPGHLDEQSGAGADPVWHEETGLEHVDELTGGDDTLLAGDLQAALATPGGTVFDLMSDHEPHWLEGAAGQTHSIDADHYAHSWARDDGTGMIGALMSNEEPPGEHEMDLEAGTSVPGYSTELVHGKPDELAARLWSELRPQASPPRGAGGEPLPARDSLAQLAREVDDPVARSVVTEALNQVT
jgi:hypothetical protein